MSTTQTLTTPGAGTFTVPVGITSLQLELWGAGASGGVDGAGGTNESATGGGAGAYSKKNSLTVSPGDIVNYYIGNGGASASSAGRASGNNGEDTWFKTSGDVLAKAGLAGSAANSGSPLSGGQGGDSASCVGDTKFSGGRGGNTNAGGGIEAASGGGGSAGDTSVGGNGADITSGAGAGGTAGTTNGAAGTAGKTNGTASSAGTQPGSGSGGVHAAGGTAVSGKGGDGQIKVTYTTVLQATVTDTVGTTDINVSSAAYNVVLLDTITLVEVVSALRNIWRDTTRSVSTFVNQAKTFASNAGSPIGLLLALTQAVAVSTGWTDQTKNTSTFNNQTKS